MNIDYNLLGFAADHYKRLGYEEIEAPWVVTEKAKNITCPTFKEELSRGLYNIDSGEQSFVQLMIDNDTRIKVGRKLFCITPCYRPYDKNRSNLHVDQFVKLELFIKVTKNYDNPVFKMIADAEKVFNELGINNNNMFIFPTRYEERRGCIEMHNMDITSGLHAIELGSYGLRRSSEVGTWVYGTGLALPRFQMVLKSLDSK